MNIKEKFAKLIADYIYTYELYCEGIIDFEELDIENSKMLNKFMIENEFVKRDDLRKMWDEENSQCKIRVKRIESTLEDYYDDLYEKLSK